MFIWLFTPKLNTASIFIGIPMIEDGPKLFGYLLSLNAVVVIVVQYPLIMIAKRYSTILSLTTGNVLLAGSLFAIAFSQSLGTLAFIIVVFTIGEVLLFAMMDLFVDNIAKPEVKGSYFGAMGFSARKRRRTVCRRIVY